MEIHKIIKISVSVSFLILMMLGVSASAQTVNPAPNTGQSSANAQLNHSHNGGHMMAVAKQIPSCQNILNECKKIGFIEGQAKEDNGLWKDCFDPLVKGKGTPTRNGQAINVPVNSTDVQTCQAAIVAAHKAKQ